MVGIYFVLYSDDVFIELMKGIFSYSMDLGTYGVQSYSSDIEIYNNINNFTGRNLICQKYIITRIQLGIKENYLFSILQNEFILSCFG